MQKANTVLFSVLASALLTCAVWRFCLFAADDDLGITLVIMSIFTVLWAAFNAGEWQ